MFIVLSMLLFIKYIRNLFPYSYELMPKYHLIYIKFFFNLNLNILNTNVTARNWTGQFYQHTTKWPIQLNYS